MPMLTFDGHLDLAWNALAYDREQTLTIGELRRQEGAMSGPGRGRATTCLPEMRRGGVAMCFATLLARAKPGLVRAQPPERTDIDHGGERIAAAVSEGQLAYYRLLQRQGQVRLIRDVAALNEVWSVWLNTAAGDPPVGLVLLMEGADPILDPEHLGYWWNQGLRAVSLAHYGPGVYAWGTPWAGATEVGGVTVRGRQLLKEMEKLGIMLDLTHLSDPAFFEAVDQFSGRVFASHSNCRALAPGPRQLSDEQLKRIIERGGVIGIAMEVSMLQAAARPGEPAREAVSLETVVYHIDHVCQLAGSARHAAIGSDLDGGFGAERCPRDLDTIADLQRLEPILASRGYSREDIAAIFYENWLGQLRRGLPGA